MFHGQEIDALQANVGTLTTRTNDQDAALSQLSGGLSVVEAGALGPRVDALEAVGDNIPGKLKVDGGVIYDPAFVLHVGLNTVMAHRYDAKFVDTETLRASTTRAR